MKTCDNRWGNCTCTKVKGHKKSCVCQHNDGIEFPLLSDRKGSKRLKEDMTHEEELVKAAAKFWETI